MDVRNPVSSVLSVPPTDTANKPVVFPSLSLFTRMSYAVQVWVMKALVSVALRMLRLLRPGYFQSIAPTYTKRYSVRPMLETRVFLPRSYTPGDRLPLYIDIHGGGFAICDPATDDHFCHQFADMFGYCVVSIDYRKAPSAPFPVPVHDCAELARAVLADDDLPVDHEKIVLGGFSAGGNLSLAIVQFQDLRRKIKAVVPIYPVVDFTEKYRGEYRPTKDGRQDVLKIIGKLFNWAYLPAGIDRTNPLLSSLYASPTELPKKMYFVGAEYDVLCNEANVMAKRLAGIDDTSDLGPSWSKNGIRWEMVSDLQHGFTHMERSGEEEIRRTQFCTDLYTRIDTWIRKEVFLEQV